MSADAVRQIDLGSASDSAAASPSDRQGVGRLLTVFAALFLDNVRSLEDTVSQVTDLVTRDGRPDNELIVTLQSFDRLKQEFEALGAALALYADSEHVPVPAGEGFAQFARHVIDAIVLADLRDRLLSQLQNRTQTFVPSLPEPSADEIDVDVIF